MAKKTGRSPGNPARGIAGVSSTGITIEASHRHHSNIDWQPGQHLWMALGMWQIKDPSSGKLMLDVENLMTIEGPGCYICEEPYTPELAAKACPGDPSGMMERTS